MAESYVDDREPTAPRTDRPTRRLMRRGRAGRPGQRLVATVDRRSSGRRRALSRDWAGDPEYEAAAADAGLLSRGLAQPRSAEPGAADLARSLSRTRRTGRKRDSTMREL